MRRAVGRGCRAVTVSVAVSTTVNRPAGGLSAAGVGDVDLPPRRRDRREPGRRPCRNQGAGRGNVDAGRRVRRWAPAGVVGATTTAVPLGGTVSHRPGRNPAPVVAAVPLRSRGNEVDDEQHDDERRRDDGSHGHRTSTAARGETRAGPAAEPAANGPRGRVQRARRMGRRLRPRPGSRRRVSRARPSPSSPRQSPPGHPPVAHPASGRSSSIPPGPERDVAAPAAGSPRPTSDAAMPVIGGPAGALSGSPGQAGCVSGARSRPTAAASLATRPSAPRRAPVDRARRLAAAGGAGRASGPWNRAGPASGPAPTSVPALAAACPGRDRAGSARRDHRRPPSAWPAPPRRAASSPAGGRGALGQAWVGGVGWGRRRRLGRGRRPVPADRRRRRRVGCPTVRPRRRVARRGRPALRRAPRRRRRGAWRTVLTSGTPLIAEMSRCTRGTWADPPVSTRVCGCASGLLRSARTTAPTRMSTWGRIASSNVVRDTQTVVVPVGR